MRWPVYLAYLSTFAILTAAGLFLSDWPWWALAVAGAIAMLPVIVIDRVLPARRNRRQSS
ncbi:hypothetical protein C6361_30285 [Plantactinospora sp. BC1]|nr:hypothetical protein C6361_30285 [Plantactinospora sp. BC1]